jgi:hypothetical protein
MSLRSVSVKITGGTRVNSGGIVRETPLDLSSFIFLILSLSLYTLYSLFPSLLLPFYIFTSS